jgi:hypothetical protein
MGEYTTEQTARIVGCNKSSVTLWFKAYREGDPEVVAYSNRVY